MTLKRNNSCFLPLKWRNNSWKQPSKQQKKSWKLAMSQQRYMTPSRWIEATKYGAGHGNLCILSRSYDKKKNYVWFFMRLHITCCLCWLWALRDTWIQKDFDDLVARSLMSWSYSRCSIIHANHFMPVAESGTRMSAASPVMCWEFEVPPTALFKAVER